MSFYHIKLLIVAKNGKTYKRIASLILSVENMGGKTGHTVFLDPEDIQFLKDQCQENGNSLSGLIRQVVKAWVREEKAKWRKK